MTGPSRTAIYAIRALVHMEKEGGWIQGGVDFASACGVPKAYLAKILHALARDGLVSTKRGFRGGYRLARDPGTITLLDILVAVDGPEFLERCQLGLGRCSPRRGCPVHAVWSEQRRRLRARYASLTLRRLAAFDRWDLETDYDFGHGNRGAGPAVRSSVEESEPKR